MFLLLFALWQPLQPYAIQDRSELPAVYQSGPNGLHLVWKVWPFSRIDRKHTAYKAPFPFKKTQGNQEGRWTPIQAGYPLVPDTEIRILPYYDGEKTVHVPHIFVFDPVPTIGEWSKQAAFLNGEWRECYYAKTSEVFGHRWHINYGLKPDYTLGDFMAWYPEVSSSWKKL